MTLERTHYDAVVIGGGLAGLTASVYLARAGKSVIILEKAERLGGIAQTTYQNGALLNFGPHAMYEGGSALRILSELDCLPSGGYALKKGMTGIWQGNIIQIPGDLSPEENEEWSKLMGGLREIDTESIRSASLGEWAERNIRHERVRLFFRAMCRQWSYCDDMSVLSAGYVIRQGQLAANGVKYMDGGWQTVVDRLREACVQAGATVVSGKKAVNISIKGNAVQSVLLSDGASIEASAIVVATGPKEVCKLVEGSERMSIGKWLAESRPLFAACLDVALTRLPDPERVFALGLDQPLYYSNHSAAVTLSDNGAQVLHVMKYNDNRAISDAAADKKALTELLSLLQPGWEEETVAIRFLPRILVSHDSRTAAHGGFGSAPSPADPEVKGLFVAGDWVGPEGRLADAAMASARWAARHILSGA